VTLEFAQSLYFRELDRRVQLDSAPTVRIAALGLIAGTFSFYTGRYAPAGIFLPWLFLVCLGGAMFFGALSIVWIIRSYAGFEWRYLANPAKLLEYYVEIKRLNSTGPSPGLEPDEVFAAGLVENLVKAAAHNFRNNNVRSQLLYHASIFLSWAVLFTFLAGVPVLFEALARWPLLD
jgi:hypothetical protein